MSADDRKAGSPARLAVRLAALVVGMFGFGFALVPLYDVLCDATGLGGRTGGRYTYDAATARPDPSRLVKVNFVTNTNANMVWDFRAETGAVRVHPGELKEVKFYVRNPTDRTMVAQAVPSVGPPSAAAHFHKTECFCFERQVLGPGESMEMPMRFVLGTDLPANVPSISLSYELFDVTDLAAQEAPSVGG